MDVVVAPALEMTGDAVRRDLHNSSTRFAAALDGRCGFTHLASGRTCLLPFRHPGPCRLSSVSSRSPISTDGAPPGIRR